MKILARLLSIFILPSLFYLLSSVAPVHAQTTYTQVGNPQTQTNPYAQPDTNLDVPKNLHTWTQSVMIEVMSAMTCQLAGIDPINPKQGCLGVDQLTNKIGFVKNSGGGAIGAMGNMIAMLYTPPIHTNDYIRYLAGNFGIVKPAYAQSTGVAGLNPLLKLWKAFSNIVYVLFVLVFVIIGLAIMLRVRIDPRTVMTIENQIPKIIIGILMVFFSFGIAGFLIDMMYVTTYLSINVLGDASSGSAAVIANEEIKNYTQPIGFVNQLFAQPLKDANGNIINIGGFTGFGGILDVTGRAGRSIQTIISNAFAPHETVNLFFNTSNATRRNCIIEPISGTLGFWECVKNNSQVMIDNFTGTLGRSLASVFGWIISWVIGVLAILIIAIALLIALFRVWFMLLFAYISILFDVVLAPFWIVMGALPGSSIGFGPWLKDMAANLLVFPATIAMFMMARIFMEEFAKPNQPYFIPPLIGRVADPGVLGSLIGLGVILYTPAMLTTLKKALKTPQLNLGPVNQSIAAGAAVPGRGMSGLASVAAGTPYGEKGWFGERGGRYLRAFGFGRG